MVENGVSIFKKSSTDGRNDVLILFGGIKNDFFGIFFKCKNNIYGS